MKKTVLTFGLIAGGIMSVMMASTIPFMDKIGFEKGEVIGYTTIVGSFLLVFFGIRSYRENVGGGKIGFGRAFAVGILITLIACLFYVVTWEIIYTNFVPDFMEKYSNHLVEKMKASGQSQQAIDAQLQTMNSLKSWYANPFIRAAFTLIEVLPIGLVITLISSAVLRKK
jgi:hypothetical protein